MQNDIRALFECRSRLIADTLRPVPRGRRSLPATALGSLGQRGPKAEQAHFNRHRPGAIAGCPQRTAGQLRSDQARRQPGNPATFDRHGFSSTAWCAVNTWRAARQLHPAVQCVDLHYLDARAQVTPARHREGLRAHCDGRQGAHLRRRRQGASHRRPESLIAHAKANPGKLSFAIGSNASAGHLATEQLRRAAGLDLLIVPYKGSTPAYQDLLGNHCRVHRSSSGPPATPKPGQLKVIAATSMKSRCLRCRTIADRGRNGARLWAFSWYGLWAPARTRRTSFKVECRNQQGARRRNERPPARQPPDHRSGVSRRLHKFRDAPALAEDDCRQRHQVRIARAPDMQHALVTGSSSGIGRETARRRAARDRCSTDTDAAISPPPTRINR